MALVFVLSIFEFAEPALSKRPWVLGEAKHVHVRADVFDPRSKA